MIIGDYNELTVLRETDIAYVLKEESTDTEVFLHKKEALKEYEPGEKIKVFVYMDNHRRMTASTKEALITVSKPAFLEVVDEKIGLGFFLKCGMIKDLLLSYDDIPFGRDFYPQIGDKLFVYMKTTHGNMRAKILPRQAVRDNLTPVRDLELNETVEACVLYVTDHGLVAFTFDGHEIFIHKSNTREKHRVGEVLNVTIIVKKDSRTYNGTLVKQKELMLEPDGKKIMDYLAKHKILFLTDDSDPVEIYKTLQMSKKAFKRAVGHLYKERLVILHEDCIVPAQLKLE